MKKTQKMLPLILTAGLALLLANCTNTVTPPPITETPDDDTNTPNNPINEPDIVLKYPKELWGEWIRMDTGASYYISGDKINNAASGATLAKQSDRVIEVKEGAGTYYLFASRTATSSFQGRINKLSDAPLPNVASRAISGVGGIGVVITNLNNAADEASVTTDGEGNFTADGIIAGDDYGVTVDGQTTTVTPTADGDDVGTITVTGGVNFKTTIKPRSASTNMAQLYANTGAHQFDIVLVNTGDEDCLAPSYELDFGSGLTGSTSAPKILGTIEPGKSATLPITVQCGPIENEYEFKPIRIAIKDVNNKTWEDSVSIKFNKEPVSFNIKSNKEIHGVIISPYSNAYPFTSMGASGTSVTLPWSAQDYLVVFSGATADTEAKYSLAIDAQPDTNFDELENASGYEPNNLETAAAHINSSDKIMAYLHKGDIDYYAVNLLPFATVGTPAVSSGNSQITVSWAAVAGATAYEVWAGTSNNSALATKRGNDITGNLSATINGLDNGTAYYVWVKAKKSIMTGGFSPVASATPIGNMGSLAIASGDSQITVSWAAVAGAEQYEVYFSTGATVPATAAQTIADTSATITGLANGTTYYVWVRDKNSTGSGGVSALGSAKPIGNMGALSATPGDRQISVSWDPVAGADEYEVYYGISETVPTTAAQTVSGTSATITGLTNGTTYHVWVKGKNTTGNSGISASKNAKPIANMGTVTVTPASGQLVLSWEVVAGAEEYEVYYSESESVPGTAAQTVSTATATIDDLVYGTTYYVWVMGKNSTGRGGISIAVTGTPLSVAGLYDGAFDISHKLGSITDLAGMTAYLSSNAVAGHNYYIILGQDESVNSINLDYSGKTVGITIMGDTIERKINLNTDAILFTVNAGVTLTLDDKITLIGRSTNTTSLVKVIDGILVMKDGAKISDNNSSIYGDYSGGGVHIVNGTFTMNGGEISGNTSSSGGGVHVVNGTFTMNGGEISGNTSSNGGGVHIVNGTFTMNGGEISGNIGSNGGGVLIGIQNTEGSFVMNGGKIFGNSSSYGGGVSLDTVHGTFTMNGGEISGNTSTSVYGGGGGVYIYGWGTFTKASTGGIIFGDNDTTHTAGSHENTATNSEGNGHAVRAGDKIRNTTAGSNVGLDSRISGAAGGWE